MAKTLLVTGATDGIGLATVKLLLARGHTVLLHGRNPKKLEQVKKTFANGAQMETYVADLSCMADVEAFARAVAHQHTKLDVLINNAGVYSAPDPITRDGLDCRFAVNTIAPYLLTQRLFPLIGTSGRVINLSSAALSPVDLDALAGKKSLSDGVAYAQSKLALTMWSHSLAMSLRRRGPTIIAVNPGSMLGSKMVREAFGVMGGDIAKGAEIVVRAALDDEFATASGQYYDNDEGRFSSPLPDINNTQKTDALVRAIETLLENILH